MRYIRQVFADGDDIPEGSIFIEQQTIKETKEIQGHYWGRLTVPIVRFAFVFLVPQNKS